jgi:Lrp/AsnC family transcriptional regulator for asnA, asnC and gidA
MLDDLDKNIIAMLQEDARASFAEVARKLNVSEGTVHLRVKKLKDLGIIRGFYTVISPEKVGKGLTAIVCIKADPAKYPNVLNVLTSMKDVYEIYDVTGEFYAVLKIRAMDMNGLTKIIDELGEVDGIGSTQTMVVLRTIKEQLKIEF